MINMVRFFAPILGSIALVWILSRMVVSSADEHRQAREIGDGGLEFAPNKRNHVAAVLFVALLAYLSISLAVISLNSPIVLVGAAFWLVLALLVLAAFPASIRVGDEGLQQVYWLWKNKRIAWKNVSKITIDEKRNRLTITGQSRARIVFTRQLPDRSRLLAELEKHCGDKLPAEARPKSAAVS